MTVTGGKPPTIYDVARLAGVSHQSVSRVLRNVPGVLESTRSRVEAALEELDYRPSATARDLAYARRNRIAVVGFETFESSTARVLRGVDREVTREGFVLEIVNVDPLGEVEDIAQRLDSINGMDVVGLLATTPTAPIRDALAGRVFRMPVFVDEHGDEETGTGESSSTRLVMDHLLDLGHRRIAHIAGPAAWDSAARRRLVYEGMMTRAGLAPLPVESGDWSAASGFAAARRLLSRVTPTAVFVANDRMALGALRAFQEAGLRVPEDVSVAGIDDIPEAEFFSPPLTTVRVDFEGAGTVAARNLVSLIRGDGRTHEYPERTLVARASSSRADRR